MNESIDIKSIRSFTPCQHNLQLAEDISEIKNPVDEVFEVQSSNIRHILSNTLDNKTIKELGNHAHIPEDINKLMYNEVAQKSLESGMQDLLKAKFSMDYDEVDVTSTPSASPSP